MTGMQAYTKKLTFINDKLVTNIMTSFDFSVQQSLEVIGDTGAYYTLTLFKYDSVKIIDEYSPQKITGI